MILKAMGLEKTSASALNLLIDVGYFSAHINLDMLKFNIRTDHSNEIMTASESLLFESSDQDEMLVDDLGDVTISNDGATILKMLDVEHPAAKVLVELAEFHDREVGDGTTSVVIITTELLKRANDLVRNKIHPTSIISGYRLAMREACKYVDEKLAVKVMLPLQLNL